VRDPRRALLATFVALTAFAIPGSAASAAPTTTTTTPPLVCTYLSKRDVERAFGEPVRKIDRSTDARWFESKKHGLKRVNFTRSYDDVATWRAGHQNAYWTTNDFGDEGYTGKALDSIEWRQGNVQYYVDVVYSTKGNARAAVGQLAKKVYANTNR